MKRPAARAISVVGHPFATVAVMVGVAATRLGGPREALAGTALVAAFIVVPVAILMLRQVRGGRWENVDASNARERPLLFAVSALGLVALLAFLAVTRPESFLVRGVVGTLGMLTLAALATRWVKLSLHLAFAALASTGLVLIGSPVGWVLAAFLPVLAWSRLELSRHRPLELVLGTGLGVVAGLAIHFL